MENSNAAMQQYFASLPTDLRCELLLYLSIRTVENLTARHPDFPFDEKHNFWRRYYTKRVNPAGSYKALALARHDDQRCDMLQASHTYSFTFSDGRPLYTEKQIIEELRGYSDIGGDLEHIIKGMDLLRFATEHQYYRVLDLVLCECGASHEQASMLLNIAITKNLPDAVQYWKNWKARGARV